MLLQYKYPTFLQLSFKCVSFIKLEFDYLIIIETNIYMYVIHIWHARIKRNFRQGVKARLPGNSSENVFVVAFLVLNLFYSFTEGFQWLF